MTSRPESSPPQPSVLGSSSLKSRPSLTITASSENSTNSESKQRPERNRVSGRAPFQSPRGKPHLIADLRQIVRRQRLEIQSLNDAISVACGKMAALAHELQHSKTIRDIQEKVARAHTQAYADVTREAEREAHIVAILMDRYELTQTDIDKLCAVH